MKLGNMTKADKVWVPLVVALVAVCVNYGWISEAQAGFVTENAAIFGVMAVQAVAVFWTSNKS